MSIWLKYKWYNLPILVRARNKIFYSTHILLHSRTLRAQLRGRHWSCYRLYVGTCNMEMGYLTVLYLRFLGAKFGNLHAKDSHSFCNRLMLTSKIACLNTPRLLKGICNAVRDACTRMATLKLVSPRWDRIWIETVGLL